MKFTHWIIFASMLISPFVTFAADLFDEGKLRKINQGDPIEATDTIGGYPIYQGEGKWKFEIGKEQTAMDLRSPEKTIPMGTVAMTQWEAGTLFARQFVKANLRQLTTNSWVGTPCSPDHLVISNKGAGRFDNCMTIDPVIFRFGNQSVLMFSIKLTNTAGSGRFYATDLLLNPALLGIRDTGIGDWTQASIDVMPYKKAFLEKLTAWAIKYQDAPIKAFDYSKPQDAFSGLESWRTLLPIPSDLVNQKYSLGFLSAVEDLKHKKEFAAIAYSPQAENRTRWANSFGQPTQDEADRRALANCEKEKDAGSPLCKLYRVAVEQ